MDYSLTFFIEKRIVIQDCEYPELEGKTCIITNAEYINDELWLCTDIQHPQAYKEYLWVNVDQIAYIKEYDFYLIQYMDYDHNITMPYEGRQNLKRVGTFDVYKKIFAPFN